MNGEPYVKGAGHLSGVGQLVAVLGLPIVGEGGVGGEGDQALPDPEQPHAAPGVPTQDLQKPGDVLPDEPAHLLGSGGVPSRKVRLVLAGIVRFCAGYPRRIIDLVYTAGLAVTVFLRPAGPLRYLW